MPVAGVAQANINKRMNSSFLIIVSFLVAVYGGGENKMEVS